jgi:hypothetical protein
MPDALRLLARVSAQAPAADQSLAVTGSRSAPRFPGSRSGSFFVSGVRSKQA